MHTVEPHYLILTPVRTQQNEEIMIIEAIEFSLSFSLCVVRSLSLYECVFFQIYRCKNSLDLVHFLHACGSKNAATNRALKQFCWPNKAIQRHWKADDIELEASNHAQFIHKVFMCKYWNFFIRNIWINYNVVAVFNFLFSLGMRKIRKCYIVYSVQVFLLNCFLRAVQLI